MGEHVARKLTTIVAADVAAYSRLMGADEEGTLAALVGCRATIDGLIARHGGRVFGSAGDSVLAEFASPVEAVRCAEACQQRIAERNSDLPADRALRYRIGIHLGDVMVSGDDLLGDGVNVAARLEGLAEVGGVCLSGSVHDQVRHAFAGRLEPMGPQRLKNMAEPIEAWRLVPADTVRLLAAYRIPPRRRLAAAALAALVAAGAALAVLRPWQPQVEPARVERMAFPLPDKPSIAVLPFNSLSEDPDQAYFADGMTEDLITDLSKNPDLFVIARNTSFAYRGKPVHEIGEELGVRYVLEGSVRRGGEAVRINAQLIDATTGGHLWAERYDGTMGDIFAMQDEVTGRIVAALSRTLSPALPAKRDRSGTNVPAAYDAFLKGWEHYRRDTPEQYARALPLFEEALELDPSYQRAQAAIAAVYWRSYIEGWNVSLKLSAGEALRTALGAVEAIPKEPSLLADQVRSQVALWRNRHDEAIALARRAVEIDPNAADAQGVLAEALIHAGRGEEALTHIINARRHDPAHEVRWTWLEGLAAFDMERFEKAETSFERSLELSPELWNPEGRLGEASCRPCIMLIATQGHLGGRERAANTLARVRQQYPQLSLSTELSYWSFHEGEELDRFREGLLKAGVPEL